MQSHVGVELGRTGSCIKMLVTLPTHCRSEESVPRVARMPHLSESLATCN